MRPNDGLAKTPGETKEAAPRHKMSPHVPTRTVMPHAESTTANDLSAPISPIISAKLAVVSSNFEVKHCS